MQSAEIPNFIPALPEIFLALAAMALLMLGAFQKEDKDGGVKTLRLVSSLAITALLLALLLVTTVAGGRLLTFNGLFVTDSYAVYFKILVLIASTLTLVISRDYLERQDMARFEYVVLVLFATIGMMMMISANDLISLYLGLELQGLSLYVVASFQRDDLRSTEAGLKYFVLGSVASAMLLYGSSLVYGFSGTTNFDVLSTSLGGDPSTGLIIGIVFILAGLSFKVSAVPFHMWTPDVYEGAPTPVTAFFSVAPKLAAVALLVRVMMGPFGDLVAQWQQIVVFVSIASMLLGAFAAVYQRNIKRMMAYSSIGHIGYALIGLAAGTEQGVRGILIYMAVYLFMNIGVFALILTMRRGERMVEKIDDLAGLGKTNPMMAFVLAVFMFSMAGIPPLAGFFSKFYIFLAAIEAQLYTLAVIGVLSSVVGAFYYLRLIKIAYFDEPGEALDRPVGRDLTLVLTLSGLVILFFFVYPSPVLSGASAAAAALF